MMMLYVVFVVIAYIMCVGCVNLSIGGNDYVVGSWGGKLIQFPLTYIYTHIAHIHGYGINEEFDVSYTLTEHLKCAAKGV